MEWNGYNDFTKRGVVIFSVLSYKRFYRQNASRINLVDDLKVISIILDLRAFSKLRISQESRSWGRISLFSPLEIQPIEFLHFSPNSMETSTYATWWSIEHIKLTSMEQNCIFFFSPNPQIQKKKISINHHNACWYDLVKKTK